MRYFHLGLEVWAQQFYQGGHRGILSSRRNFEQTGMAAARKIVADIFPTLPGGQNPEGILVIGIARAGCALATAQVAQQVGKSLRLQSGKEIPVWLAAIGASRPKEAQIKPADIYFSTLGNFQRKDWSRWMLIIVEYGLATGSTVEAVIPHIRQSLPGSKDENLIIFANCACVSQAEERLNQVSSEATLAYGSPWEYRSEEGPQQFYLYRMLLPDGSWWETEPRDWGGCCFYNSPGDFLAFLKNQMIVSPEIERQIIEHFANLHR